MKPFAIMMICALLASCAMRPQPYVEPTEGPVASISFINKSSRVALPRIYENHETCSGAYNAGIQSYGQDELVEVKVKAEAPLSFSYGLMDFDVSDSSTATCDIYLTFTPEKSATYIAVLRKKANECTLGFYNVVNGEAEAVDVQKREGIPQNQRLGSSYCRRL